MGWGYRLCKLLRFCSVLSFPCCINILCYDKVQQFSEIFLENIVTVSKLFASAMIEYSTTRVFDCVAWKCSFLQTSQHSLFSAHLKYFLEMRFLLRLEQTEMALYKINLVQALSECKTTLSDCHLDSILPTQY